MENMVSEDAIEQIPDKLRSESSNGFHQHLVLSFAEQPNRKVCMTSLQTLKSPQVQQVIIIREDLLENLEHHKNSDLVTPFLKLYNWTFLVPDSISFDKKTGEFSCKKRSILVRVTSYIWLLFAFVYGSLILFNDIDQPLTIKALIGKLTWLCYTLFDVTVIYCLRANVEKIGKLLTEGNKISQLCDRILRNSDEPVSKKKERLPLKYLVWLTCFFGLLYTCGFVLFVIIELTATTTNLCNIYLNLTATSSDDLGENECSSTTNILYTLFQRSMRSTLGATLLGFWVSMAFTVESIWVIFLLMTSLWGFYFKRLFAGCIYLIETRKVKLPLGIQIYTRITVLLEEFNRFFGTTLLWIAMASLLYVASTIAEFLAGHTNGFLYDSVNIIGFFPFCSMLYTGAELHTMGQLLPLVIKKQSLTVKFKEQQEILHVFHTASIVQYDALSQNLGMKGNGFFTISYTFVASLAGLVMTYSLLALQFKLGEIPLL